MTTDPAGGASGRNARLLLALFVSGLCLRPPIVAVTPLLPTIRGEFGLSYVQGGLLTAISIFCMGLFALPAAAVFARLGPRASVTIALGLAATGGTLRAAATTPVELYVFTMVAGIGAGLAGALLPAIVRQSFSSTAGRATGVYSVGINGGASVALAVAIPLANLAGSWRGSSVAFGVAGMAGMAIWLALSRGETLANGSQARPASSAWGRPRGYVLGVLFGLQAICFFGLNTWLPSAAVERGWSAVHAGWLVAMLNFLTVPASLLVGLLGDRFSRAASLCLASSLLFIGLTGVALLPAAIWLWTVSASLACGALFPLLAAMSVDAAKSPREAASIASIMFALGYLLAGLSPAVLGIIRDMTPDFTAPFLTLAAVSLVLFGASFLLARHEPAGARPGD